MFKYFTAITAATLLTLATGSAFGQPPKDLVNNTDQLLNLLKPRVIFPTSVGFTGDLVTEANTRLGTLFLDSEGLEAGDALCQSLADDTANGSIVPEGEYVALLSTDTVNASARITPSSGPYIRPDGAPVAANFAALFSTRIGADHELINCPCLSELGDLLDTDPWTGTRADGTKTFANCSNWASALQSDIGIVGFTLGTDSSWLMSSPSEKACTFMFPLYCVQR